MHFKLPNISLFIKSKNGKVLVGNFSYLLLLQIASYIFPLITIPYLAKVIGAVGFGKIAFATAIISWVHTIADWGFSYTATRDVAKNKENIESVSRIISDVTWARTLLTLICGLILSFLVVFIPIFRENIWVIFFTFLMVPGHILFPEWFFQAVEKMQYITFLNVLSKLCCLIAIFIFVKKPEDYLLQPLFISLGYMLSGAIAIFYIFFKWGCKLYKPNTKAIILTLKNSTDVFINNLMPNLYHSFSTMLLSFVGGDVATGKLDAGGKFSGALQQFMQVIFRTFFPFLSRRIEKHRSFAIFSLSVSFFLCSILFIFAPIIIRVFFTEEFSDCVIILQIMSISVFFLSMSIVYGTNYLILIHKENILRNITTYSSLAGFIISYPLIQYWGAVGAALTICFSRSFIGIFTLVAAKRS